jgi:hypothetical protein
MMGTSEISTDVRQRQSGMCRWQHILFSIGISLTLVGIPALAAGAPAVGDAPDRSTVRQAEDEGGERPMSADEMTRCLLGKWMHSIEEDTEEVLVYRPGDYPFPPAFGRTGYEFIAAGYLVYYGFGPADEPEVWNGRWELIARNTVAIDVNQAPGPNLTERLDVVSCGDDLLEIAR